MGVSVHSLFADVFVVLQPPAIDTHVISTVRLLCTKSVCGALVQAIYSVANVKWIETYTSNTARMIPRERGGADKSKGAVSKMILCYHRLNFTFGMRITLVHWHHTQNYQQQRQQSIANRLRYTFELDIIESNGILFCVYAMYILAFLLFVSSTCSKAITSSHTRSHAILVLNNNVSIGVCVTGAQVYYRVLMTKADARRNSEEEKWGESSPFRAYTKMAYLLYA